MKHIITSILLVTIQFPGVLARAETYLDAPCLKTSGTNKCEIGLKPCSSVLRRTDKNGAKNGVLDNLEKLIETKIKYFYKGSDVNIYSTTDATNPKGSTFPLPVCNLLEGEVTTPNQDPNKHPSPAKSCGQYVTIDTDKVVIKGDSGTREASYLRGGYVQAIKCFKTQVVNEIEQNYKLNASNSEAIAADIQASYSALQKNADTLQGLCGQAEFSSVEYCQSLANSTGSEADKHKQAVCYDSSARERLESAFTRVAYLEITQRAKKAWQAKVSEINSEIDSSVIDACKSWALNGQCKRKFKQDAGCVVDKFTQCYRGESGGRGYHNVMKDILQRLFPDNGSCSSAALGGRHEVLGAPFFGFIAFSRRRRNKRKSRVGSIVRKARIAILAVFLSMTLACNDDDEPSLVTYCKDPLGIYIYDLATAQQCCAGGSLTETPSPPLDSCPIEEAGDNDDDETASAVLDDLEDANEDISNANDLAGGDETLLGSGDGDGTGGDGGTLATATAGNTTKDSTRAKLASSELSNNGTRATSGRVASSSDGATPTASSTSGDLLGSSGTQPASLKTQGSSDAGNAGDSGTNVAYAAGGSHSGVGASEANNPRPAFGESGEDVGSSASGSVDFRNGNNDVFALAGEDPADYFTRINLDESLFKIVEKRYRKKTLAWLTDKITGK